MISKNGKPFLGTHWDGYPGGLGKSILKANPQNNNDIMRVASEYSLNFAEKHILLKANKIAVDRIKAMPKKNQFGYEWALKPKACMVVDIKTSGEWWEYQYDLKGGKWYFRPLSGSWPGSLKTAPPFKLLTASAVRASD